MRITQCDSCRAAVNDYAYWYNNIAPRNMYELRCVHDYSSDTYEGKILCHKCIQKLLYGAETEQVGNPEQINDVLDRIIAEIKLMPTDYCGGYIGLDKQEVLQIINKHKGVNI